MTSVCRHHLSLYWYIPTPIMYIKISQLRHVFNFHTHALHHHHHHHHHQRMNKELFLLRHWKNVHSVHSTYSCPVSMTCSFLFYLFNAYVNRLQGDVSKRNMIATVVHIQYVGHMTHVPYPPNISSDFRPGIKKIHLRYIPNVPSKL